jgi:Protein of unknown function (DUF2726)
MFRGGSAGSFYSGLVNEPMGALIIAIAGIFLLLYLMKALAGFRRPPYRRGRFLTANEKSFLSVLDDVLGRDYRVFAQVRLAELVDVPGASQEKRFHAMKHVFGKSVDFVICSAATFEPLAAIELDDRSHLLAERRGRDGFVNSVFDEIGLPLIRIRAQRFYERGQVLKALVEAGIVPGVVKKAERIAR